MPSSIAVSLAEKAGVPVKIKQQGQTALNPHSVTANALTNSGSLQINPSRHKA